MADIVIGSTCEGLVAAKGFVLQHSDLLTNVTRFSPTLQN